MALKQRGLSFSLILVLLLGGFLSPVAASELSDAEQRYAELRRTFDLNLEAINVSYPGSEAWAKECINRLSSATSPEDVSTREGCQVALARFETSKSLLISQNEVIKLEIAELELRIQALRASSGSATPMSGSAGTSSGGSTTSSAQSTTSPTASSSTQTSDPQSSQSTSNNSDTASPAPTPSPAQNSESQVATSAPTTSTSPSPSAVSGSKVSATPKPVVKKKKTITCVKGKVTRKVTAPKPVCPRGFKVKKK